MRALQSFVERIRQDIDEPAARIDSPPFLQITTRQSVFTGSSAVRGFDGFFMNRALGILVHEPVQSAPRALQL
jgi:hypothetical protein